MSTTYFEVCNYGIAAKRSTGHTLVLASLRVRTTRHQRHDTRYCLRGAAVSSKIDPSKRPRIMRVYTAYRHYAYQHILRGSPHAYQEPAIYPYTAVYYEYLILKVG